MTLKLSLLTNHRHAQKTCKAVITAQLGDLLADALQLSYLDKSCLGPFGFYSYPGPIVMLFFSSSNTGILLMWYG